MKERDTIPKSDIRSKGLSDGQKTLLVPQETSENLIRYTTEITVIRQPTVSQQGRSYHDRSRRALNIESAVDPSSALWRLRHWWRRGDRPSTTNGIVAFAAPKFERALCGFVYFWYCLLLCICIINSLAM